jgi:hypothetical protein
VGRFVQQDVKRRLSFVIFSIGVVYSKGLKPPRDPELIFALALLLLTRLPISSALCLK